LLFATCATLFLVPTMFSVVHASDRNSAAVTTGQGHPTLA
jgi:hypothetical protein